jgi:hypothetical protein
MNFLEALQTEDALTENMMPTHSTSGNPIVDMFFQMGGSRGMQVQEIVAMFIKAFGSNGFLATRALFYNRDVRGGQGERRSFRIMFRYLANRHPEIARLNIPNVPYYGRWDDLLVAIDTPIEDDALDYILHGLKQSDGLCAKWMPREGKQHGKVARYLAKKWSLTPREYRLLLAGNTKVVESLMCANDWGKVIYEHVPSVAMKNYRKAFSRHDAERFVEFLGDVKTGKKKIKAGAIFPHDIVKGYLNQGYSYFGMPNSYKADETLELQWKALPDYMPKGLHILPVCDVSGSMMGEPLEVCVALGIYMAERNVGPYKDCFITFSATPKLQQLPGTSLADNVGSLCTSKWDMNTNLEAVFKLVLAQAVKHKVAEADMPKTILILSDMQFDQCITKASDTGMGMIERMYSEAGYQLPNVVFWNLRTSTGVPVKFDKKGTALVSGFSPSILKSIFNGDMDPIKIVMRTLESERYDRVQI